MSLYQININRNDYLKPVDIKAVYAALASGNIEYDTEERANNLHGIDPFEINEDPEYVFVDSGVVGAAVHLINELGYTTDEDEDDSEDKE